MPLAFNSLNHGTIAFGFFNIDTDLLLLEHYFLFADDFCAYLSRLAAQSEKGSFEAFWEVHSIERLEDVGDLMGAIHGIRFTGFIGEVYRKFPFPRTDDDFKQKPEGYRNRKILEKIIAGYASKKKIPVRGDADNQTVSVAEYLFTKEVFRQLVNYIWLGGFPRWREEVRPGYVEKMKSELEKAPGWLFQGFVLHG